jgi:arylsulfatase A-like enzyme
METRNAGRVVGGIVEWAALLAASCGGEEPAVQGGTQAAAPGDGGAIVRSLVHLTDAHETEITSAPAPAREAREWVFDAPRPEWRTVSHADSDRPGSIELEQAADALRLTVAQAEGPAMGPPAAGIVVDLEPTPLADWTGALVRARSHDRFAGMAIIHNIDEEGAVPRPFFFFGGDAGASPIFNDGSVQTYHLPFQARGEEETLRSFALLVGAMGPGRLDVLSITLVPRGADFVDDHGVRPVTRHEVTRRTLFAHTPAAVSWRMRLPEAARLDLALTTLPEESVAYRIELEAGGEREALLEETLADPEHWASRSIDLAPYAGKEVALTLAAESEDAGSVALFGTPIVSGASRAPPNLVGRGAARRPNVVFYVIDGGGADQMSVYGYNRRTTPFLESLAAEGVVFERAHSNSTWTQSSTASFMTGLHHSVLGGLRRGVHSTPVPAAAVTMAEHMRMGGYLTLCFTANPNAGRVIGLERGIDVLCDEEPEDSSTSSTFLHERFFAFREQVPAQPYWVHFQTTDVHDPNFSVPPFSGLFVSKAERAQLEQWDQQVFENAGDLFGTTSISDFYDRALERAKIDRQAYYNTRRGLYDETMAYQDRELGRLVENLKKRGEWQDTLLVIGADHGHPAGTFPRWGRGLFEPPPPGWEGALFDSYATRVPLIIVWPGHIEGGRRYSEPVSMIDVLPTILDLVGLPAPEVLQGRSLAPFLRGEELPARELVFDEFRVDEATGEMIGNIELVDGRWGASLEVGPVAAGADPAFGRHATPAGGRWGAVHPFFAEEPRLLLYDLEKDPFAVRAVNEEHPELVEHYRKILLERWDAHRALATQFQEGESAPLDPAQLEQLRALGYVR